MLNFENIGDKFVQVVHTPEWEQLQEKYNQCNDIYVLGHGGNMAVADHAAVDMTRLSNGTKNAICPSSGVVATSYINDTSFEQWMVNWLISRTSTRTVSQMRKSLVLGISSSGNSVDILKALQWAETNGMQIAMITSKDIPMKIGHLTKVILGADYYHTAEVLTLLLTYQLTHGSGNVCPPIGQNDPEDLKKLNWKGGKIREHSYPDEQINVGVDFDKVIHKCSKGYHDGTIYDEPVAGAFEALQKLSESYVVIVYTCKAKPDRGLVNGKTGTELVWEWLKEHNMAQFVSKVTAEKPRARFYIDDKAIRFTDWESTFDIIEEIDG
jgi:phosphoheptose isomerase|tara:strand:+ start:2626 stop:3600 length:975 start_codon:yes stop_codon:yes gene_type:complete